ncbi:hypothetical protein ACTXT7_015758 [Hymenolepis weldensis]
MAKIKPKEQSSTNCVLMPSTLKRAVSQQFHSSHPSVSRNICILACNGQGCRRTVVRRCSKCQQAARLHQYQEPTL